MQEIALHSTNNYITFLTECQPLTDDHPSFFLVRPKIASRKCCHKVMGFPIEMVIFRFAYHLGLPRFVQLIGLILPNSSKFSTLLGTKLLAQTIHLPFSITKHIAIHKPFTKITMQYQSAKCR
jgi:hypothetical protein